jgi:ABC-type uncharacterized transport system YnjBCD ATPase subunit
MSVATTESKIDVDGRAGTAAAYGNANRLAGVRMRTEALNRAKIAISNLDFFYGGYKALSGISLKLPEKQVTGMIGPSGCGKSTLLRVLNRLHDMYPGQRATGEVLLDGQDILGPEVDLPRLRSRIGMVFQEPTPFPMSIRENIAFGVTLYEKLSRQEMDERVEGALIRRAVDRGQGQSVRGGRQAVGRPAAASLYRSRPRDPPGGDPTRRADQRARSDQHAKDRGSDQRAEEGLNHCHRHSQPAAGRALRRPGRVLLSRRDRRDGIGGADVHRPPAAGPCRPSCGSCSEGWANRNPHRSACLGSPADGYPEQSDYRTAGAGATPTNKWEAD